MKRSKPLTRRTRLQPGDKPLATVNPTRQAARRKAYAAKLRAMKQGAGYREAMERAGGRCEGTVWITDTAVPLVLRCHATAPAWPLHAHHVTYARFGGRELATDFLILCPPCHAALESQHPTRRRGR